MAAACAPAAPDATSADDGSRESAVPGVSVPVERAADPASRGWGESDFPRLRELAPGVHSYEALRSAGDERFTTNSLIVVTEDGVLVADGQGNETESARLVEAVRGLTDQPIRHVVVCSDHGDHTGGNRAFPADATIWAHPSAAVALESAAARAVEAGREPPPTAGRMVTGEQRLQLGGRDIRILHLGRGHTAGDLAVYLPRERILFLSEAYLHGIFPAMRSAYPSEWVATIERAQGLDVDLWVPGHGFVDSAPELAGGLEAFRVALITVIDEARRLHAAGVAVDEAVATARFGDLETWSLYDSQAETAIRRVYAELDGQLPAAGS